MSFFNRLSVRQISNFPPDIALREVIHLISLMETDDSIGMWSNQEALAIHQEELHAAHQLRLKLLKETIK